MPYRTERVSGRCRQASHPAPPSKQPPGQGALYVSEDNVTSCAMQAFIAGYCEISLIKSVSERRNYFEPGTDEYYNRKANTSSANTIGNDTGRTSRATKSPSSYLCKSYFTHIFIELAQPFGSSQESLNVIGLCIFLSLLGNANYLPFPAPFQKNHRPIFFLSKFRKFFLRPQQSRYNRQK